MPSPSLRRVRCSPGLAPRVARCGRHGTPFGDRRLSGRSRAAPGQLWSTRAGARPCARERLPGRPPATRHGRSSGFEIRLFESFFGHRCKSRVSDAGSFPVPNLDYKTISDLNSITITAPSVPLLIWVRTRYSAPAPSTCRLSPDTGGRARHGERRRRADARHIMRGPRWRSVRPADPANPARSDSTREMGVDRSRGSGRSSPPMNTPNSSMSTIAASAT